MTESTPVLPYTHRFRNESPAVCRFGIVLCVLAALCSFGAAGWIPSDRHRFAQVFSDFRLTLPAFTQAVMAVPDVVIWIAGAGLAAGVITAQCLLPSKRTAIDVQLIVIALCFAIVVVYREAMLQTFMELLSGMNSGGRVSP